jgi:hypothetical protein
MAQQVMVNRNARNRAAKLNAIVCIPERLLYISQRDI